VEDTMTTGHSTLQAVEAVRSLGAQIVGVLTVVNRSATAGEFYEKQGLKLISIFTGEELVEEARRLV
jgi:orotate phosphoribosyltransferase